MPKGARLRTASKHIENLARRLEVVGRNLRPRSHRRPCEAESRRRSAPAAPVARFRGSCLRRGARPATRGCPSRPPIGRGRRSSRSVRRTGSRSRCSQQARGRGEPSRRRDGRSSPRGAIVAERRRTPEALLRARRTCWAAGASRDPCRAGESVSGRRPKDVKVALSELAAGIGRVELESVDRPDCCARAPSKRMATVPVGAAYLIAEPRPSAPAASRSAIRLPSRWACNR